MTFTKEQLQQIEATAKEVLWPIVWTPLRARKHFEEKITPDVVLTLARMALAGMEAEPVGVTDKSEIECLKRGEMANVMPPDYKGCDSGDSVYLYDGPQPLTTSERAELENYRKAQQVVPGDIDARMKSAGMLSASEIIAGQPIDAFLKHAGVVDMGSLLKWSEMRRAKFLRMQAKYELGDHPKDDMYEWVISHAAAFSELHVNIRAAMLQAGNSPVIPDGCCIMPMKLTAENGAKGALSGEFHVSHHIVCQSCGGKGCEDCNEEGGWDGEILIGWDIIKQIHDAAVKACSLPAAPQQEV